MVCMPKWAGDLGIPNLRWLNYAMQARWPWLQRSDPTRPWSEFQMKVPKEAIAVFRAATRTVIGDGRSALFWEDRWLDGYRVQELAPSLYEDVPGRFRKMRTVHDAVSRNAWARDLGPELTPNQLLEYFSLWDRVATVELDDTTDDRVT